MNDLRTYRMAPLIRGTLVLLYLVLVLPLLPLAPSELRPFLTAVLPFGLVVVLAISSERVQVDPVGISVRHPLWCQWVLRRGWHLAWSDIKALTPVATSQGGRVYYVRDGAGSAYLLPQRVQEFDDFLARFSHQTGLDTTTIGRISPPWTYQLLAVLCSLMLLAELLAGLWMLKGGTPA
jgi:hypothetical protein